MTTESTPKASDEATLAADQAAEAASAQDPAMAEAGTDDPVTGEVEVEPTTEELLEAARAEAAENYDRLLRMTAEVENMKRRHQRDLSDRAKYDGEALARDVITVVDDLDRALAHADADATGIIEGVSMAAKSFADILERNGVTRIASAGEVFDPNIHEAVAMVETADHAPNTVIEEHRAGYLLRDRLLRAALVVVAKAPTA